MMLETGSKLGPYEVVGLLGAGGMGEVYKAWDTRLARDVAIKILPSTFCTDAERLRRFEQEAKAASSLSHPNILAIYDIGDHDGSPYIVSELLEGETLRHRLTTSALAPRKAVDIALQITKGLAAAHEKGIIHRDLKPENLFVTKDGRVKILDFGLAKYDNIMAASQPGSTVSTLFAMSEPGKIMGTVGYMSPEQVRGLPVDHRSDIFSFGTVLYEMLTGKRAFKGESAVETMNAILKEEPEDLLSSNSLIPPGLERIIRHCLEKSPHERFQSAYDLAFGLESLSDVSAAVSSTSSTSGSTPTASGRVLALPESFSRRRILAGAIATLVAIAIAATSFVFGRRSVAIRTPSFNRLTFRRGAIWSARFAPDGSSIVYGAQWEGGPFQLFVTRPDSPEARSLDLDNTEILSISTAGEMAIRQHKNGKATMARVPLGGGAPREVLEDVSQADWSPDGSQMAVTRWAEGRWRLEYPIGTVIYESSGSLGDPRISPKGDWIAFIEYPTLGDDLARIVAVSTEGEKKVLTANWASAKGLSWTPRGDEIWFTATEMGKANALRSVTIDGEQRLVSRVPGRVRLHDISRDGRHRVLLAYENKWGGVAGSIPDQSRERALAWLDGSVAIDISPDGTQLLIEESGEGGGNGYSVYMRKLDGSPAVRLGDGSPQSFSPDGRWALSMQRSIPGQLVLLPTGAGTPREIPRGMIEQYYWAHFMPDGEHVLFAGNEPGQPMRFYKQKVDGSDLQTLACEGTKLFPESISPDGKFVVGIDDTGFKLCPIDGGEPTPIAWMEPGDRVVRWSRDGKSIAIYRAKEIPAKVQWVDFATGRRELWKEIGPADIAGVVDIWPVLIAADQKTYAYSYTRVISDLYIAEGLK